MVRLGHTVLISIDVPASRQFFEVGLGFTHKQTNTENSYCELLDDYQRIVALVSPALLQETFPEWERASTFMAKGSTPSQPTTLLSLQVQNFPEMVQHLKALGAVCEVLPCKMVWGKTVAVFQIPYCNGVYLELTED
jgi:hypothetical protein